jgi:predicted small secreted protein
MKNFKLIMVFCILVNTFLLGACQNTANGMHQDWRNDTQSVANSINNS